MWQLNICFGGGFVLKFYHDFVKYLVWRSRKNKRVWSEGSDRIPNLVDGCQDFGIYILVKLCIYPYIINHVIWIILFGKQESLDLGIKPGI